MTLSGWASSFFEGICVAPRGRRPSVPVRGFRNAERPGHPAGFAADGHTVFTSSEKNGGPASVADLAHPTCPILRGLGTKISEVVSTRMESRARRPPTLVVKLRDPPFFGRGRGSGSARGVRTSFLNDRSRNQSQKFEPPRHEGHQESQTPTVNRVSALRVGLSLVLLVPWWLRIRFGRCGAVNDWSAGKRSPAGTKKRSPPVMGILFH